MALYASILTGGTNNHTTTSEEANYLATDFVSNGIIGNYTNTSGVAPMTGAFACNAQGTPDMTIAVTSGACYVTATPSGQNSQQFRVKLSANQNATIAANSSGSTKYDWVYVAINATTAANPNLAGDDVATITISRSSSNSTDNGTPPTYGYLIAVVTVANGASSITNGNIRDTRAKAEITANSSSVTTGWVTGMAVPSTVTANGNGSYTLTHASSVASIISPGMRRRFTRTVAAPTTAFSLDGSNDFYNKTSPAGMTFTDDFVVSAWIYLTSYSIGDIVSRYNGTSGWILRIGALGSADGRIQLVGLNGSSSNYSAVVSYQSVPLNKWVHIAAQLDMSTFTATTTTSYIMINGKDVPAQVLRGGTNPTALVQAGNLEIGSENGGTLPFPGYLDQVAIYNAKVTQATILASMNQALTGSETSLISAYSNGSTTDLSANANNLTAQNGATTVASSWHGNRGVSSTLEYGLTMSVSSDGLTEVVQVPEGCALPTSGGITSSAYSTMANPYGWVSDKGQWEVITLNKALQTQNPPASNTWYFSQASQLVAPIGRWEIGYVVSVQQNGTAGPSDIQCTLSTSSTSETDNNLSCSSTFNAAIYSNPFTRTRPVVLSSQTTYYLISRTTSALASSVLYNRGDAAATIVKAIPSNL